MVEFELLQGSERAISLLHQLEPSALELARLVENVAGGRRLAQERPRDEEDDGKGQ
jgi:hypothetical protein